MVKLPVSGPRNIKEHLGSGPLADLASRAGRLARLDTELAAFLGEPLSSHCRLANIRGTTAVVHADTPAWSARIRYQLPQILQFLNQRYPDTELTEAHVRVLPP